MMFSLSIGPSIRQEKIIAINPKSQTHGYQSQRAFVNFHATVYLTTILCAIRVYSLGKMGLVSENAVKVVKVVNH